MTIIAASTRFPQLLYLEECKCTLQRFNLRLGLFFLRMACRFPVNRRKSSYLFDQLMRVVSWVFQKGSFMAVEVQKKTEHARENPKSHRCNQEVLQDPQAARRRTAELQSGKNLIFLKNCLKKDRNPLKKGLKQGQDSLKFSSIFLQFSTVSYIFLHAPIFPLKKDRNTFKKALEMDRNP